MPRPSSRKSPPHKGEEKADGGRDGKISLPRAGRVGVGVR